MVANVAKGPPAFASTVTVTRRKEAAGYFENTRRHVTTYRKLDPLLSDDTNRHIKTKNLYRSHVKEFYV